MVTASPVLNDEEDEGSSELDSKPLHGDPGKLGVSVARLWKQKDHVLFFLVLAGPDPGLHAW